LAWCLALVALVAIAWWLVAVFVAPSP